MASSVAIVGATGAVGIEMLRILAHRDFPIRSLRLLASERSAHTRLDFKGRSHEVEVLTSASFSDIDFALFSAGASVSREFAPAAVHSGAVVIDNSSAFRMQAYVPLVIPEVNPAALASHSGIIANPNCSAIILLMAVAPLHRVNPIRRIIVSTYQAVSGAGRAAMNELVDQTKRVLDDKFVEPSILPHQCAFNVFSHNSAIGDNGYNGEEQKMVDETQKILDPEIRMSATCVRVPVLRAHSESVLIEFAEPMSPEQARVILARAPGVRIVDDRKANHFPMPIEADGGDDVLVGRIRQDTSRDDGRGLHLFIAGDQLRKGAALNAIQIAEYLSARK